MNKYGFILPLIMFLVTGCHRPEIITSTYSVPGLDNEQKAATLRQALESKLTRELQQVEIDVQSRTLTVSFNEKLCRAMNVEQVIAETGFSVNHRPAFNPKRKK
ncbi:hypothetical protein ACFLQY_04100 [Verrucomicrobiota bacterium]